MTHPELFSKLSLGLTDVSVAIDFNIEHQTSGSIQLSTQLGLLLHQRRKQAVHGLDPTAASQRPQAKGAY